LGKYRRKHERERDQFYRTRSILNIIAEPVHDIAFLFTSEFQELERKK